MLQWHLNILTPPERVPTRDVQYRLLAADRDGGDRALALSLEPAAALERAVGCRGGVAGAMGHRPYPCGPRPWCHGHDAVFGLDRRAGAAHTGGGGGRPPCHRLRRRLRPPD